MMKIRKATAKDLKRIDELYVEGSIDENKYQFPGTSIRKDLIKHQRSRIQGFRKYMKSPKHHWIVIENKKEILGFGQAWIKDKTTGITESVYIDKKHRKKGAGKKIIKELISWLRKKKVKKIESGAYINNKPSIKLHEKVGFKPFLVRMRIK